MRNIWVFLLLAIFGICKGQSALPDGCYLMVASDEYRETFKDVELEIEKSRITFYFPGTGDEPLEIKWVDPFSFKVPGLTGARFPNKEEREAEARYPVVITLVRTDEKGICFSLGNVSDDPIYTGHFVRL